VAGRAGEVKEFVVLCGAVEAKEVGLACVNHRRPNVHSSADSARRADMKLKDTSERAEARWS